MLETKGKKPWGTDHTAPSAPREATFGSCVPKSGPLATGALRKGFTHSADTRTTPPIRRVGLACRTPVSPREHSWRGRMLFPQVVNHHLLSAPVDQHSFRGLEIMCDVPVHKENVASRLMGVHVL
jgi:hypothetical protein